MFASLSWSAPEQTPLPDKVRAEQIDINGIKDLARAISSNKASIRVWVDDNPPAKELVIANPDQLK